MKTYSRVLLLIFTVSFLITFNSCNDCDCIDSSFEVFDHKDITDLNEQSEFHKTKVAVYNFTQTITKHTPENADCDCGETEYVTKLSITNTTAKTLVLKNYSVYFTFDQHQWVYRNQETIKIAPNTVLEVGEISTDSTNISKGLFTMFIDPFEYE